MTTKRTDAWFETVRQYTVRLVHVRGISPHQTENTVAQTVLDLLTAEDFADAYTAIGLDPLEGDPYQRHNVYAFLRGESKRTIVLLGHFDTVDTQDYGPLEPWALDPEALAERQGALLTLAPELRADLEAYPGDWMFGRGSIDMKSGVAANIAVMRHLAEKARTTTLPISIVMLATPDEENESAGILQAVRFLLRLRQQHDLTYLGAINTDYTTALYPNDPHRYVNSGTVGKLLPSFLIVGKEAHVGEPFLGVDANLLAAELIRDLSMNDTLCDVVPASSGTGSTQVTPPPVTLRASDLKAHYDVQLPFAAYFYLNVLTFTTTPGELLGRLQYRAMTVMSNILKRLDTTEQRWNQTKYGAAASHTADNVKRSWINPLSWNQTKNGVAASHKPSKRGIGTVLTYAELYAEAVEEHGEAVVEQELAQEWQRWPTTLDKRERSLHLTYRLWAVSGKQGPAIILYYSPPYYPHVAPTGGPLHDAIAAVIAEHPQLNLEQQSYYPFISDMSYLRLDPGADLTALKDNMPVWQDEDSRSDVPVRPGAYHLPFKDIQELGLPIVNFGPYGFGAHQRGERVLMSYSFGVLPELLYETIEALKEH
ncbi:MAG: M20/M25/M40 family metallo-hydrolase [Ktedonobacteraceae bacterium]